MDITNECPPCDWQDLFSVENISGHNSVKTARSSHEESVLIKPGVEGVDWFEKQNVDVLLITNVKRIMHIFMAVAVTLNGHG